MNYQRPYRPAKPDPEPEDLYRIVIEFRDNALPVTIKDQSESVVAEIYDTLGGTGSKFKYPINGGTGIVMVPGDRIKSITATKQEIA